jgi:hypothetical protein
MNVFLDFVSIYYLFVLELGKIKVTDCTLFLWDCVLLLRDV